MPDQAMAREACKVWVSTGGIICVSSWRTKPNGVCEATAIAQRNELAIID